MPPCPTETNICALFQKTFVESISGDRLCVIEQIFVFALLSRRKCGSMIAQWKLVLRLSGAEEGTPPPIHIPRMWNLLRILRIERSIRRKPHLIVMGRKAAKTINKMLEMILNIFFAVLFSCADSGSFFYQKWR